MLQVSSSIASVPKSVPPVAAAPVANAAGQPSRAEAFANARGRNLAPSDGAGTRDAKAGESQLKSPDWVKDAVFYQVFPERFKNGDTSNDPQGTVPWGTPPGNDQFFEGGDLQGVSQGMGHLAKLGVNALYLNPIFTSPSNHKYDTADYRHVDPAFGGDAAFSKLVDQVHAGGMKLILDGVFNHSSNENVWFKDVREKGSQSKYWSWYNVYRHPIETHKDEKGVLRTNDYEGWGKPEWGGPYATLPVLQSLNPEVMNELVTGQDSVLRKWTRDSKVDGWRMDVADEVETPFWQKTREVLKKENPDAYLIGENWQDASGMLGGDTFDGATNYKYFQQPATEFFAQKTLTPDQFAQRLQNGYPKEGKLAMLNFLESHDTPRFITTAGGDWYRARPAAIFQMTYQGAPSIYYGAEIGMEGGPDPDSRRAFDWGTADKVDAAAGNAKLDGGTKRGAAAAGDKAGQLFGLYQKLIKTREETTALRRGDFEVLATHNDNGTIAYRRFVEGDDKDVVVALNNSATDHPVDVPVSFAPDGTNYVDALTGERHAVQGGHLKLDKLDGNWGAVLLREAAAKS
ncbi:MAG: alpha amylase catalytic region [Thermoleophilia bacterium]|nr:alpha amylase catalytic region [Thermoleophilia bacterium]